MSLRVVSWLEKKTGVNIRGVEKDVNNNSKNSTPPPRATVAPIPTGDALVALAALAEVQQDDRMMLIQQRCQTSSPSLLTLVRVSPRQLYVPEPFISDGSAVGMHVRVRLSRKISSYQPSCVHIRVRGSHVKQYRVSPTRFTLSSTDKNSATDIRVVWRGRGCCSTAGCSSQVGDIHKLELVMYIDDSPLPLSTLIVPIHFVSGIEAMPKKFVVNINNNRQSRSGAGGGDAQAEHHITTKCSQHDNEQIEADDDDSVDDEFGWGTY